MSSCLDPGVQWRRFVIHEAHCRPASSDEVLSLTYRLGQETRKQLVFVNLHNRTMLTAARHALLIFKIVSDK